jgi:hypothetical protein
MWDDNISAVLKEIGYEEVDGVCSGVESSRSTTAELSY